MFRRTFLVKFFSRRYLKCQSLDPVANLHERVNLQERANLQERVNDLDLVHQLVVVLPRQDTVLSVKRNELCRTLRDEEPKMVVI